MQETRTYRSPQISVIGLKTGDIVTFSPVNDTLVQDKDWDSFANGSKNGGEI